MTSALEKVREEIAAFGATFNQTVNERTRALYAPLISSETAGISISSDVRYGSHARQTMDVYKPEGISAAPILMFVPGGGFNGGDKNIDAQFYSNIGIWFARHGFLAVLMNYRLAPDFVWPTASEDVGNAIDWIYLHAADFGGDQSNVTLFAQSAGAAHAASYLFNPNIRSGRIKVSRAVLASGIYDLSIRPLLPGIPLYYGADERNYDHRSAIRHVHSADVPILLTYSEFDPPVLAVPTLRLAEALANARGKLAPIVYLEGHNHVSNVLSFGSGDDRLGRTIVRFAQQKHLVGQACDS